MLIGITYKKNIFFLSTFRESPQKFSRFGPPIYSTYLQVQEVWDSMGNFNHLSFWDYQTKPGTLINAKAPEERERQIRKEREGKESLKVH